MALRDWTRKTETGGEPPAKFANLLSCPRQKAQNSRIAKIARGQARKLEPEPVDYDVETSAVLHELGEAGVLVTEAPEETRRECAALEDEITEAVNARDVVRFRAALHAWRLAWLKGLH